VSAIAGAIHYLWKVKIITGSPVYYAVIIGVLLAFRIVWQVWNRRPRSAVSGA